MFLLLLACAPAEYTLTGVIEGTSARVGVSVVDEAALFFIAGSGTSLETLTGWYSDADLYGTGFRSEVGGWSLDGTVDETAAEGTLVSPDDEVWTFELLDAGVVFDAVDSDCRDGAVLYPGTAGLEIQGVWCDGDGDQAPMDPVNALSLDMEVLQVQVETDVGLRAFDMGPVIP